MINRVTKYLLLITFALILSLSLTTPVAADFPPIHSTDLSIDEITAFENVRETGDQLYLVGYYISTDQPIDTGNASLEDTYSAHQLFIFRLFDESDTELSHTRPFPYVNNGYGVGVVAFYLSANETPTWESGVYVKVSGNPLVSWNGSAPSATNSIIDWNTGTTSEMQIAASGKILELASQLTVFWGVQMTTVVQGVTVLTDEGAIYFTNTVPYLSEVAPYCLGQYTFSPDYPIDEKPATDSYADWLLDSVDGTVFDLGPVARARGISQGSLTAGIYYGFIIGLFVALIVKGKLNKGTMLVFWPFVVAGAFFGVPLQVTIIAGFLCLISTVWVFYKGTT